MYLLQILGNNSRRRNSMLNTSLWLTMHFNLSASPTHLLLANKSPLHSPIWLWRLPAPTILVAPPKTNILRISTCMESRFAVESFFISAVGAELQLSYGRIQFCGGGRSQYCSELAPLVERPSDFLNPSIPDRKYMFRIGTCMKTNFVIDRRFRSAEVSELQLFYGRSQFCGGRSQCC